MHLLDTELQTKHAEYKDLNDCQHPEPLHQYVQNAEVHHKSWVVGISLWISEGPRDEFRLSMSS